MKLIKCPKCGSQNFKKGQPIDSSGLRFKPEKSGLFYTGEKFEAFACLNCGYAEFYVDPQKLREKVKK